MSSKIGRVPPRYSTAIYVNTAGNIELTCGIQIHRLESDHNPLSRLSIQRHICTNSLTTLQRTGFNPPSRHGPRQPPGTSLHSEIRQRQIIRIPTRHARTTIVPRLRPVGGQAQYKVAAIIPILPLQLRILLDQTPGVRSRLEDRAHVAGGADRRAGELYAYGALACFGGVGLFIEPDEVGDPVLVAVAGEEDCVCDRVGV